MAVASCTAWLPLSLKDVRDISRKTIVDAANTSPVLYQQGGVTVTRVHRDAVLKWGPHVRLSEAWNMLIVQSTPNVRLPTVIDAWEGQHENERIGYLLMEHVEGASVAEIWHGLDIHAREDIQSQLCNFLRQLHTIQLPSPGPIGGAVSCGPLFTDYGAGPFKSKRDMESWFNERLLVCKEFHRAPQTQPLFSGRFENLVMCHMDIAARNLILDRHHKIWVLDWAQAGGYPVYFERAVLRRTGDPDFAEGLLKMLKEEHSEDEERLLAVGFALTTAAHTRPAGVSSILHP